ncbi:uncharacterized protein LOC132316383 [Cornus florida]|uniref:uncharacterized protein LOC132316383 n=1 Tax=Cornus florida TaxID=4283 RepID=UPI002897C685|nr:uncharacterized protein LOC132316383 [Cornus florida]
MAGATARVPRSHRILPFDNCEIDFSGWPAMSLSDTIFGFLDAEGEGSPESVVSIEEFDENDGGDGEKGSCESINEGNKTFWETQHQLLHATVRRSSSLEARIRDATKEALKEVQITGNACVCRRPVAGGCRDCLMREVCGRLQNAGYNGAICKSKWKSSPDIPSGEHSFLDVVDKSNPKKGEVRVIIELNFRAEFEMARASEEYKKLISNLPEVFVGKVERLHSLLKILCSAAKKCMKEKKIHMGPWRKHRYMQAKWLSTCKRTTSIAPPLPTGYPNRPPRPRASMLTLDLLENLPNLHRTVVEVV